MWIKFSKIAHSAKEAAEYGELVAIAVLDDVQVEAVLFEKAGVFAGAKSGTIGYPCIDIFLIYLPCISRDESLSIRK